MAMAREQIQALQARMQESIIGQEAVVERIIIGLLAPVNGAAENNLVITAVMMCMAVKI